MTFSGVGGGQGRSSESVVESGWILAMAGALFFLLIGGIMASNFLPSRGGDGGCLSLPVTPLGGAQ